METPTREKPGIQLPGGPLQVMRGYEVLDRRKGVEYTFLGAHDGPLLQIRGPNEMLRMSVEFASQLVEALQAALIPPVAENGAHDAEIRALGFEPLP